MRPAGLIDGKNRNNFAFVSLYVRAAHALEQGGGEFFSEQLRHRWFSIP
jgi:hypothetical protein